ncbi:DUF4279 domain-containing protein [Paenibacillus thiaminolyticus]|uniref:DUF4279 domain-containing protein n=1 Tax=Paenibacillus thiaminolyticus TaxID=49283 RepID=UPI0035A5B5CE
MDDLTNIMAEFVIVGEEFPIGEITKRLVIEPSEFYSKGDKVKNRNIYRKETSWSISTGYEPSLDINTQLSKLIISLENKKQDLIDLKQTYKLDYKFCIVVRIEQNQSPSIYLDNNTISFANEIQAEFDIDLYIF